MEIGESVNWQVREAVGNLYVEGSPCYYISTDKPFNLLRRPVNMICRTLNRTRWRQGHH